MDKIRQNIVLISYVLFVISALFLSLFSISYQDMSFTLYGVIGGVWAFMFWVVVLAGIASCFWKHKYVYAVYVAPLVFVLLLAINAYGEFSNVQAMSRAMMGNSFMKQMMGQISIGMGFYLVAITSIVLAVIGIKRTLKAVKLTA